MDYYIRHADLLEGAVDLHLHIYPSLMERRLDVAQTALRAEQFGYKAFVHKDHHANTAGMCTIVQKYVIPNGKVKVLGSVCLNNAMGGLKLEAVQAAIGFGAKIIWLPTVSARNHMDAVAKGSRFPKLANGVVIQETEIRLLNERGEVKEELVEILKEVKKFPGVIIATGHGDYKEINKVVEKAAELGMADQIMVDHPDFILHTPDEVVKHWAELGVWIEWIGTMYLDIFPHHLYPAADLKKNIDLCGIDRCIINTDLGQKNNLDPILGMDATIDQLLTLGYTKDQVRQLISGNASKALRLDD